MAQTISARITLEGSEEIARQLADLAKASAQVFRQIEDIAKNTDIKLDPAAMESFDDLAKSGAKLAEQFDGLAKAATGTAPEVEKVGEVAAASGEAFDKLGQAAGQSAENIAKAGEASAQAASNVTTSGDAADKSSTSYTGLGLAAVRTGAAVATAAGGLGQAAAATAGVGLQAVTAAASLGTFALVLGSTLVGAIGAAAGALAGLGAWLAIVATADEKLSIILDHLALNTQGIGESFTKLQVGQAAFERIGVSAETFRGVIAKLGQELANLDATKALAASEEKIAATTRKALEAQKALIELRIQAEASDIRAPRVSFEDRQKLVDITEQLAKKTADVAQVENAAAQAQKERAAAQANNLKNIVELMAQVEAGAKGFKFDELTTGATKLEAIKIRLQDVAKAGGDVSQSLLQIIANLPRPEAFAVGKAFGLSETDIDRVRRYGAEVTKIPGLYENIAAQGVKISSEDAAAFDRLAESTQRVESAGARLRQAWESTFFSRIGAEAVTVFNNIEAAVLEFGGMTVENFNMLSGQLGTTLSQIVQGWGMLPGILGQAFGQAGTAIGQWMSETGAAIQQWATTPIENAWGWIKDAWNDIGTWIGTKINEGKAIIEAWVTTPVANAWQWIVDKWNAMLAKLGFGGGTPAPATEGGGGGLASGGLLGGRGTGTSDSNLAWVSRGEYITPAHVVGQPGVLAFLELLRRSGGDLHKVVATLGHFAGGGLVGIPRYADGGQADDASHEEAVSSLAKAIVKIAQTMIDAVKHVMQSFADDIDNLKFKIVGDLSKANEQFSQSINDLVQSLSAGRAGLASGGLLGGRGTGTSDSNLAWVSRGEYIVPARAVAQPGVLAFLEALRGSGGDLRDLLDGMGRFAAGGLVIPRLSVPAFAGGGMNNVTIQFPGLPEITGLRASSSVVDELRKAAALAQVRSGGRKPSRYS